MKKNESKSIPVRYMIGSHVKPIHEKKKELVEISGFEPEASRMQSERSTTELYPLPHLLIAVEHFYLFGTKQTTKLIYVVK